MISVIHPKKLFVLTSIVVFALSLGACGVRGDPQTPPPMWGDNEASQELSQPKPHKNSNHDNESDF